MINVSERINVNITDGSPECFITFDDRYLLYMKYVLDTSCIRHVSTRNSTKKLSQPLRRTTNGQNCISFLAPSA